MKHRDVALSLGSFVLLFAVGAPQAAYASPAVPASLAGVTDVFTGDVNICWGTSGDTSLSCMKFGVEDNTQFTCTSFLLPTFTRCGGPQDQCYSFSEPVSFGQNLCDNMNYFPELCGVLTNTTDCRGVTSSCTSQYDICYKAGNFAGPASFSFVSKDPATVNVTNIVINPAVGGAPEVSAGSAAAPLAALIAGLIAVGERRRKT